MADEIEIKLTDKQRIFCHEYLIGMNATQAAIKAGYSVDTAKQIGCENLSKPYLQAKIQDLMDMRAERVDITADRVLVELSKIAFADVRKIFADNGALLKPSMMDDETSAAIQSIEVVTRIGTEDKDGNKEVEYINKIKLVDKKAALECLGKNLKLFTDKVDTTVSGSMTVTWDK